MPGQFVQWTRALLLRFEVRGQRAVRDLLVGFAGQVRLPHRLAQEVVREGQQAAPVHQRIARSQIQRTPNSRAAEASQPFLAIPALSLR